MSPDPTELLLNVAFNGLGDLEVMTHDVDIHTAPPLL
jgi:hypothetical protein